MVTPTPAELLALYPYDPDFPEPGPASFLDPEQLRRMHDDQLRYCMATLWCELPTHKRRPIPVRDLGRLETIIGKTSE